MFSVMVFKYVHKPFDTLPFKKGFLSGAGLGDVMVINKIKEK